MLSAHFVRRKLSEVSLVLILVALTSLLWGCGGGGGKGDSGGSPVIDVSSTSTGPAQCVNGRAAGYPCNAIALEKQVDLVDLGAAGGSANDIWGWTDSLNGREYALVGLSNGVSFVDVTTPSSPVIIGRLPTETVSSVWRDIKVFSDHAYVVADNVGAHGMQVFNLTRLRNAGINNIFSADTVYGDIQSAHNVAINEETGFAYIVGSDNCAGGLHMVDLATPVNPLFTGCHSADGDSHDAQCVLYTGPDSDHTGKEICFDANEDHVAIVDVSTKSAPITLAQLIYPNLQYVHQNWLTEDQQFLFVGDELDEQNLGRRTGTIVLDVTDLDAPRYLYTHIAATQATDHNLYVRSNELFQANYTSGLRILEFAGLAQDSLTEVAFFDTVPDSDGNQFEGAWSVYPFFPSGNLIVSDKERGLFILSR